MKSEHLLTSDIAAGAAVKVWVSGDHRKTLHSERMEGLYESISCDSGNSVVVKLLDEAHFEDAKAEWQWVNDGEENVLTFIVDEYPCGGEEGRQPYVITEATFDPVSKSITLQGVVAQWADAIDGFVGDAVSTADAGGTPKDATNSIGRRDTGNGEINVGKFGFHDKEIVSKEISGVQLAVSCQNCGLTGALKWKAHFSSHAPFFDLELTTKNGFGLAAVLDISVSGTLSEGWEDELALEIPLPGRVTFGFASIGPVAKGGIHASIGQVTAELKTTFGGYVRAENDRTLRLSGESDDLNFRFEAYKPVLSGSIGITAEVAPTLSVVLEAEFGFGKFGGALRAGAEFSVPYVDATAEVQVPLIGEDDGEGFCGNPTAKSGVTVLVETGGKFKVYAEGEAFGNEIGKEWEKDLWGPDKIVDECFAIGGSSNWEDPFPQNMVLDGSDGRQLVATAFYAFGSPYPGENEGALYPRHELYNEGNGKDDTPVLKYKDNWGEGKETDRPLSDIRFEPLDNAGGIKECDIFAGIKRKGGSNSIEAECFDKITTVQLTDHDFRYDVKDYPRGADAVCIRCFKERD